MRPRSSRKGYSGLPPLKFYERGMPNHTLHAVLQKNVRIPDIVMGDLHGQVAAGHVGQQLFIELLETSGVMGVREAIQELMDRAEMMTRARLSEIPDGSYTCVEYLDNDGVDLDRRIAIQAAVTIKGSEMYCDFTGTSPQVRRPLNCVPTAAIAGAYYVVVLLLTLLFQWQYSLRDGSSGAGRYRGGLGGTKIFEATHGDVVVSGRGERYVAQPWRLAGGQPVASVQAWVERTNGSIEEIPSKRVFTLHQGEVLHVDTPGGGGYGDPLERDPEAMRQDACDRRITMLMAREQYGVMLQELGLSVDQEAT